MMIKVDKIFSDEIKNYDMLVLPGGRPGGVNLGANPLVIEMVQYYNENGKYPSDHYPLISEVEWYKVLTNNNY